MLDRIVLHGEFSLFTVIEATFGTKFIEIGEKSSVLALVPYYTD